MSVFVQKQGGKAEGVTAGAVRERAALMLAELDLGGAELSVLLTSDRSIHRLNREFRSKDKPTDVLAFAMREGEVMGGQQATRARCSATWSSASTRPPARPQSGSAARWKR
jgi:probable rRNA maturation factor